MSIPASTALLMLGVFVLLQACDSTQDHPSAGEVAGETQAEDTVFSDMTGTMDRARAVEDTVTEQKRALDRAIDEAGGG